MSKEYSDLLKDERWEIKRKAILERDGHTCQQCGEDKGILHVHHKYYDANTPPWEYPSNSLITLCELCHSDWDISRKGMRDFYKALLCAGWSYDDIFELVDLLIYYSPYDAINLLKNG